MPRFRRSRGGCATCKRRKRKCDETRPACMACRAKGIECDGYDIRLRWGSDSVASASHHGSRASSKPSGGSEPTVIGTPESNAGESNAGESNAAESNAAETTAGDSVRTRSPPTAPSDTSPASLPSYQFDESSVAALGSPEAINEETQLAFQRFLDKGIHNIYSTTIHEWVKPLIADEAKPSTALFVVCANLQIFLEDGHSLRFHQQFDHALRTFQAELSACNGIIKARTLGAGLLLCTLSILRGFRWTTHLLCTADLYNLHGDLQNVGSDADLYTHHCFEVMGIMDLPSLVLGRTTAHLGFWRRFRKAQRHWVNCKEDGVEPVSGLPRLLLDVFARIDEPGCELELWLWPGEVGEFVQMHLWDAWRFSGMLEHRRRWRGKLGGMKEPPPGVILPTTEQLVFRLMSCLEAVHLGLEQPEYGHSLVGNSTLYPFVMASLEFQVLDAHPHWRNELKRFRDKILSWDPSLNAKILFETLEEAEMSGGASFDADAAMRAHGAEIALF